MSDESRVLVADLAFELEASGSVEPGGWTSVRIRFVVSSGKLHYSIDSPTLKPTNIECETLPDEGQLKQHGTGILEEHVKRVEEPAIVHNFSVMWRD